MNGALFTFFHWFPEQEAVPLGPQPFWRSPVLAQTTAAWQAVDMQKDLRTVACGDKRRLGGSERVVCTSDYGVDKSRAGRRV